MIELNGKYYKLCLIDTCIISELLKCKGKLGNQLYERFIFEQRLFCYSIKTIEELFVCKDIFNEFIQYTKIMPTVLLKTYEMLLDEELDNYNNDNFRINPVLHFVPMMKKDDYYTDFQDIFKKQNIKLNFELNNKIKPLTLNYILKNAAKYPKGNVFLQKKYIENWMEEEMRLQLYDSNKEFIINRIESNEYLKYDKLLSLKSMSLMKFYKFYLGHRKPKESDIFDIYISSIFPYVDSVLLEKDMSNQVLQIKNKHNFYTELEILKLSDFVL